MPARAWNVAIGIWVVLSVLLFGHSRAQGLNTVLCGGAAALLGLLSVVRPALRYADALVGVWLIASLAVIPGAGLGLFWSSLLSGMLLVAVSLARAPGEAPDWTRGPYGHRAQV